MVKKTIKSFGFKFQIERSCFFVVSFLFSSSKQLKEKIKKYANKKKQHASKQETYSAKRNGSRKINPEVIKISKADKNDDNYDEALDD